MVSGCLCGWVYLGSLEMDGRVNASADVGQPETLIRVSYGLLARRALAWWMVRWMGRYAIVAAPWRTLFSGCLYLQTNHLAMNRRRSIA